RSLRSSSRVASRPVAPARRLPSQRSGEVATQRLLATMTHSGLFESPPLSNTDSWDTHTSGDFSTTEMVCRLEPTQLRFIESSLVVQEFLGWSNPQLRKKSFLDVVHPDDRQRAQEKLHEVLAKGELHGLVIRIKNSAGKSKAIEMNVSARYGLDLAVTHLRCHITDVTDKLRAERELRLRTSELTQVNEQLRRINRELEELKDRYS